MSTTASVSLTSNAAKSLAKSKRINRDMLLESTTMPRSRDESVDKYFDRVTHLQLQSKRLAKIEGLEVCKNLKCIYLYDNQIEVIEGLDHAKMLSYLYLQNNLIISIPRLCMANLRKIFLDQNEISTIGGLELCTQLEELRVAKQRLPKNKILHFEKASLNAIASSLVVLDVSGNNLTDVSQFRSLFKLQTFCFADNALQDIGDIQHIMNLPELTEVTFRGNPFSKLRRYRDYAIGWSSPSLKLLDGEEISMKQKLAYRRLTDHRKKLGVMPYISQHDSQLETMEVLESNDGDFGFEDVGGDVTDTGAGEINLKQIEEALSLAEESSDNGSMFPDSDTGSISDGIVLGK